MPENIWGDIVGQAFPFFLQRDGHIEWARIFIIFLNRTPLLVSKGPYAGKGLSELERLYRRYSGDMLFTVYYYCARGKILEYRINNMDTDPSADIWDELGFLIGIARQMAFKENTCVRDGSTQSASWATNHPRLVDVLVSCCCRLSERYLNNNDELFRKALALHSSVKEYY